MDNNQQSRLDVMRADYEQKIKDLKQQNQQLRGKYDRAITNSAIKDAFINAGGVDDDTLDINPLEVVTSFFSSRIKIENDRVILLNRFGQPELTTLNDKMSQLKRGSMAMFFDKEKLTSSNPNLDVYNIEDARSGRADIGKIAIGRAIVR
jgi:hypothetical protein